ncbi:uncharacterized protein LOC119110835 [Pollicipes pollicipes]|uniref:uncharacterized protein LOC119110832 n=1 Tax=Pollicipes pollicipes TaxID=41117 RepID=UPI0018858EB9|nr:uncharacterized protein LOC119110832 [Pollicipes pollicipes]XP_037090602.1 uncharacterized protein LOC119110835 [Pollicipes pollicipes]
MENPYLTTPALLGLSQHTAGFSEALRMSRTFAHQAAESKDYGGAFGGGPLALRSFDFPSLPSPLFLSSPFLPAGMDPRLPFGGSAFHPVTSAAAAAAAFDRKFFAPAKLEAKCEPAGEYGEVSSTAGAARRPPDDEERHSSGSERSSPEDARLKTDALP